MCFQNCEEEQIQKCVYFLYLWFVYLWERKIYWNTFEGGKVAVSRVIHLKIGSAWKIVPTTEWEEEQGGKIKMKVRGSCKHDDDYYCSQLQSKGFSYIWIYSGRVLSIHSDPCQALTTKWTKMKNYRKWKWEIQTGYQNHKFWSGLPNYSRKVQSFLPSAPYDH